MVLLLVGSRLRHDSTDTSPARPHGHPILFYAVDDIHAAFAAIKAKGAPLKEEPRVIAKLGTRDVWLASAEDPDGHMVGIMCEVPVMG